MGARLAITIIAALLALVGAAVGVLFVLQNAARTTQLSLDLWFAAWELSEPVPVMILTGIGFVAGFVACMVLAAWRAARVRKRMRNLEQQVALGGDPSFR